MTDTFDAVLAEMRERANAYPAGVCMDLRVFANRLRDAHHAAIAHGKRANQAAREELDRLTAAHAAEVAEIARLSEKRRLALIAMTEDRTLQRTRAEAAERDARELRDTLQRAREDINWMLNNRQFLNGPVFDYLDAAIATTEQDHD